MRKFDCSCSGGTQRSSVNQTSTPDQSGRIAAARSYAERGVEPPVRTTWPEASASSSAAAPAGSSMTWRSGCTAGGILGPALRAPAQAQASIAFARSSARL